MGLADVLDIPAHGCRSGNAEGLGGDGHSSGRWFGGHRRRVDALSTCGRERRVGGAGFGLVRRAVGGGTGGGDAAFLWSGPAAVVPVLLGCGAVVAGGHACRRRDFSRWLQVADKPVRAHWRHPERVMVGAGAGGRYSAAVRAHSETVLRAFYEFHRDEQTGPAANPFPVERSGRGGRAHAHHSPMEPHGNERVGLYRPKVATRIPRAVPDEEFNEIFARLPSHRDLERPGFGGDPSAWHRPAVL